MTENSPNTMDSRRETANDSPEIRDLLGRRFKNLRLSLTDRCSLACIYCVGPDELRARNMRRPGRKTDLEPEQYARMVGRMHELLKLTSVRLTGGEPLLYRNVEQLVALLKQMGIPEVNLTTNAVELAGRAEKLKAAGLDRINVSLDALDENKFRLISRRRNVRRILDGIEKALKIGLPVKINCTVLKGINDDQILPIFEYARNRGMVVRYLELMNMGHLHREHERYFLGQREILEVIASRYQIDSLQRKTSSTSEYWMARGAGVFGVIANHSSPFCHDCDRLRLDSQCRLYGCLSVEDGFPICDEIEKDANLTPIIERALRQKQKERFCGSRLSMQAIGG